MGYNQAIFCTDLSLSNCGALIDGNSVQKLLAFLCQLLHVATVALYVQNYGLMLLDKGLGGILVFTVFLQGNQRLLVSHPRLGLHYF